MYIKNATIAVIFRVIFIIVCGAGLVVKLMDSGTGPDVLLGDFALAADALSLIYFAYLVIARPGYERGTLRGAVTIYMILTSIVYYYIEFGAGGISDGGLSLSGYLLWFISPVDGFYRLPAVLPEGVVHVVLSDDMGCDPGAVQCCCLYSQSYRYRDKTYSIF